MSKDGSNVRLYSKSSADYAIKLPSMHGRSLMSALIATLRKRRSHASSKRGVWHGLSGQSL